MCATRGMSASLITSGILSATRRPIVAIMHSVEVGRYAYDRYCFASSSSSLSLLVYLLFYCIYMLLLYIIYNLQLQLQTYFITLSIILLYLKIKA